MSKKHDKKHDKHGKREKHEKGRAGGGPAAASVDEAQEAAPVAVPAAAASDGLARAYRLKFYLNAQHYVVFDGKRGETHPHTWEFTLVVSVSGLRFTPFSAFERGIDGYLAPFQNKVLNEVEPFVTTLPTLENLVEVFAPEFDRIIAAAGGRLTSVEGSEGPTRGYILRKRDDGATSDAGRQGALELEESRVIDEIVGEVRE